MIMDNIPFIQCNSGNYTKGRTSDIQYIVIHFTSNNGDTAENNCNYFANNGSCQASAHIFVDENGYCQSVKLSDKAWHCGGTSVYKHPYCRNANSIGIEMCSRIDGNGEYYIKAQTVSNTIALTKELMRNYDIPIEHVIRHYDVWDKCCPEPFVKHPEQWEEFKNRLESEDNEMTVEEKQEFDDLKSKVSDIDESLTNAYKILNGKMIYNYIDSNMPDDYKPTIQKLVGNGYLKGNEKGELLLTDDMIRILVILDRMGKLD